MEAIMRMIRICIGQGEVVYTGIFDGCGADTTDINIFPVSLYLVVQQ